MKLPDNFVKLAEQALETTIFEAEGLYVKQIVIPRALSYVPQHAHALSHLTMLAVGTVNVWRDGEYDGRFVAPFGLYIEAGVKHMFQTLTDNTVLYCIHELTSPDALKVLAEHNLVE